MATPSNGIPIPRPQPNFHPVVPLGDAFLRFLALVATAPVRSAKQIGPGAVHPDGLDVSTLRILARRWCTRAADDPRFGHAHVRALSAALNDFSDEEFQGMAQGAVLTHLS